MRKKRLASAILVTGALMAVAACSGQTQSAGAERGDEDASTKDDASSGSSGGTSSGGPSGSSSSGSSTSHESGVPDECGCAHDSGSDASSPEGGNRVPENHRPSDAECQTQPAAGSCQGASLADGGAVCAMDNECTSGVNGRCVLWRASFAHGCSCTYDACSHDADCSAGRTCACHGSPYNVDSNNTCVAGNCRVDADCGQGGYCSPSSTTSQCGYSVAGYYCHTSYDTCVDDADCTHSICGSTVGAPTCVYSSGAGHWACACVPVCS